MTSRSALAVLLLAAAACAASCSGDSEAETLVRMRASDGRMLTYVAERTDDWADPEFGYGGTLKTRVRYRTMCVGTSPRQRLGTFDVRILALAVDAPTRFGMVIDTATPEVPLGDLYGAEEIARSLLERDQTLRLDDMGRATPEPVPDATLRDALRKWAAPHSGIATPAMILLDDSLDGPRFVARWNHACGLMLPAMEVARDGAEWKFRSPPFPSPAGQLSVEVNCKLTASTTTTYTIEATGTISVLDDKGAQLTFESGAMTSELVLDHVAGTVKSYHETMSIEYLRPDGRPAPTRWERTLTLEE